MSDILSDILNLDTTKKREAWMYLKTSFGINQLLRDLKKHHRSTPAIRKNLTNLSNFHVQISLELDEIHTRNIVQLINHSHQMTPKNEALKNEELKKMLVEEQQKTTKPAIFFAEEKESSKIIDRDFDRRNRKIFADNNGEMTEIQAKKIRI